MIGMLVRASKSIPDFASGLIGTLQTIPSGFEHKTVVVGSRGVNKVFQEWGDFNLQYFNKRRVEYSDDEFLSYLGYWTDNGAYYYYTTEKGKNYQDTLIDVVRFLHTNSSLPIKNIQYDSWWYPKDKTGGGALSWEPLKGVFPDMAHLNKVLNLPVALHSRYFSNETIYRDDFEFYFDGHGALPKHKDFFTHIMKKARDEWGLKCYEQDWLCTTYDLFHVIWQTHNVGREWMMNMFQAAYELELTIQLCMNRPTQMMQTLEFPHMTITNARASDDYCPCTRRDQKKIGATSMFFYWALGIMPSKDNFWTTNKEQTGCHYSCCVESQPILQTVVAALSGGPVGPSDKIGFADNALIMETCDSNGLLLRPDRPATTIDAAYARSFGGTDLLALQSTFTCLSTNVEFCWFYVYSIELPQDFTFEVSMLPYDASSSSALNDEFYAVKYEPYEEEISKLEKFDKANPLVFKSNDTTDFEMYTIIPIPKEDDSYYSSSSPKYKKWMLLKEIGKIVSVSKQRISTLVVGDSSLSLKVHGKVHEKAKFAILDTEKDEIVYVTCTIGYVGWSELNCDDKKCSCN